MDKAPGFFCAPGARRLYGVAGDLYDILATRADTRGQYGLLSAIVPPGGGPPAHVHTREDETFYILEGELTITVGGRTHVATAGAHLFAPRDVEHVFRNFSDKPARVLVQILPAGFEQFFIDVGEVCPAGTTAARPVTEAHVARIIETAPRYGIILKTTK